MVAVIKARQTVTQRVEPLILASFVEGAIAPHSAKDLGRGAESVDANFSDIEMAVLRAALSAKEDGLQEHQGAAPSAPTVEVERLAVLEQARSEGYAQGLANGLDEGRRNGFSEGMCLAQLECQAQLAVLSELGAHLSQPRSLLDDCRVAEVMKFALAVAEKVVRTEVVQNPECVTAVVTEALSRCKGVSRAVVKVHPDDLASVQNALGQVKGALGIDDLAAASDCNITRGGCVVETPSGTIDARLEAQLREIARELLADCEPEESEGSELGGVVDGSQ